MKCLFTAALLLYRSQASFLQCSPSDSLESLDELNESGRAIKQGVICDEWPFYAGGFGKHTGYGSSSSSSSSSSSEDSDEALYPSLLPETITEDSVVFGFDDAVKEHACLLFTGNYCESWVSSTKRYEEKEGGCGSYHKDHSAPVVLKEYEVCLCAEADAQAAEYCTVWACLETPEYPEHSDAFSLKLDNSFVKESSSSSSSSSSDDDSDSGEERALSGNYYRFMSGDAVMELDESLEFTNCWCKESSDNGKYCLNWYCQSLAHDEHGCHDTSSFGVDDAGWFGCYDNAAVADVNATQCATWYGFLQNWEVRHEYRCECVNADCLESVCGLQEIPFRINALWYNFWLAVFMWGCCCGCFGTKVCFKRKFKTCCLKCLRCRKCRMFLFYALFGSVALMHGGVPAFLFFVLLSSCSLWCSVKCEKCKCSGGKCAMRGKWAEWKKQCEMQCKNKQTNEIETHMMITEKDGENSKESSESHEVDAGHATKSGHIAVATIDLDEMDGDIETQI